MDSPLTPASAPPHQTFLSPPCEFYLLAVDAYSHHFLGKVQRHLVASEAWHSETGPIPFAPQLYSRIDPQEVTRRAAFLRLAYDYLQQVQQQAARFNEGARRQPGQSQWRFISWLEGLTTAVGELSQMSVLRKQLSQPPEEEGKPFMMTLLSVLFDVLLP
jgi:hypothetical protein